MPLKLRACYRVAVRFSTVLLLAASLIACEQFETGFLPEKYVVISANAFEILQYTSDMPAGKVVFRINSNNPDRHFTAVAYDEVRKIAAVAVETILPQKGSARIMLLDANSFLPLSTIETGKDRITRLLFSSDGQLAFVAADIDHTILQELCVWTAAKKPLQVLAEEPVFLSIAWQKDDKAILFSYRERDEFNIGLVALAEPKVISKIANGMSVDVAHTGKIAYLSRDGSIMILEGIGKPASAIGIERKLSDPAFIDRIQFVKNTEDIILYRYIKGVNYRLLLSQSPYADAKIVVPLVGNQGVSAFKAK